MNNYKFPLRDNLRYEDEELNDKINEYNNIYNNYNNNGNENNNAFIVGKNNENIKEGNFKKKGKYKTNNPNNNYSNYNYNNFNESIPSPELEKLSKKENEYDAYISKLKLQLSKEREERKKKEEEAVFINHRLMLLKNQEQSKLLQLQKIKQHIDKIIRNRKKSQEKLNEKLIEKRYLNSNLKTNMNRSWMWKGGANSNSKIKRNMSCSNFSRKSNKSAILMSNSQNNFYKAKVNVFDIDKNNESVNKKVNENNKEKNNNENIELKKRMNNLNNINIKLDSDNNKKLFKQQLIEKIKKDEEEKKRIEDEIAKIEEEEKALLGQLGIKENDKKNRIDNNYQKGYNEEEIDYGEN